MTLEPLETSMMAGRVAIGTTALLHTLFATFIVGSSLIAAVTATCSYVTRKEWFGKLARMIAFALVLSTATISFMGVMLVIFLNIYWPQFWHRIFNVMFWPFLGEAVLFFGEAVFAYAWYYLWDWGQHGWRQTAHLSFIWIAAGCALMAMFMIDITASYMLTPDPVYGVWGNIFNPTMIHLHLHRWFGNLTWAGFVIAGICAISYGIAKTDKDRMMLQKGGSYCFAIGYGALLVMPVVGYQYLLNLRYGQPQAFFAVMLGERSWLFSLVGLIYGLLVLVGALYISQLVRSRPAPVYGFSGFAPLALLAIALSTIFLAMPYNLHHYAFLSHGLDQDINPWGKMQPYKYFALSGLVIFGFVFWLYALRVLVHRRDVPIWNAASGANRRMASFLVTLAGLTMISLLAMGWVRESARAVNGYLIYDVMRLKDEESTYQGPSADKGVFSEGIPYRPFKQ
jgi:cytochrome bd ubiquinol oxidase subunit I